MTELMAKDLDPAVAFGARSEVPMTSTATVRQVLTAAMAAGYRREDFSSLAKVVFELAGLE
jgi:3-hydroxyisobutyrate dehydrogenase-like beta-hydroxyacid dehydrogenase